MRAKKELRYKVVHGYRSDETTSITEHELEKAKYCMLADKIFSHGGDDIQGKEIKKIIHDVHYYTGWNANYEPKTGEDFAQINRDVPKLLLDERSQLASERVKYIIENKKPPALLKTPEQIDTLLRLTTN